ncbi:glycolate oxidase [Amniculicola lignicola CBS 123094]|uniref:L-lactate dehydrogenase (cytochrome) n=1 Tax=Amniculicola lignicola CBS 123094 TaxID=1392246 RepID=A0A6A5W5W3_9PLEO|nr:glycolate oxidase [Amniculicola lignicola CBS 123094]
MADLPSISVEDVERHSKPESCWLVVNTQVWDLTEFAPNHPGGPEVIYRYAGHDATTEYTAIHVPSLLLDTLTSTKLVGKLETGIDIPEQWYITSTNNSKDSRPKPPLETLINSHDFERAASRDFSPKAWAYYSSAATDLITLDANKSFLDRIWFRPRVLRNVRNVDLRTRILGSTDLVLPFFVSPAAMARLAHPEGERAIAAACSTKSVAQCVSTNASFPLKEIAKDTKHPIFFQLYVDNSRDKSEALLRACHEVGVKAIFVTVDTPMAGKREADERVRTNQSISTPMSGVTAKNDGKGGGLARTMGNFIDMSLNWDDLKWLRSVTHLPIILKGIQSAADAQRAMQHDVQGIMISNHGARNLDTSPPSILVLLELHKCCPKIFDTLEVYLDSGIRRGTDILKALCLGATAVGIGRPFLYSLNYGREGVEHLIEILSDELVTAMRMLGVTELSQLHPGLVNTLEIDDAVPGTVGHPYAKWRRVLQAKV